MWTKQIKKSFIANTFVAMNDFCVASDESPDKNVHIHKKT